MSSKNDLTLLGEALRNHGGLLKDLCVKLDKDPAKWEPALGRLLREENPWEKSKFSILEPLTTVAELPKVDRFCAKDTFVITPNRDRKTAELIIGDLDSKFKNAFLNGDGKIEENISATTLRACKLKKNSVDGPIIAELGGEEAVETNLAHIHELMRRQGCGQEGILFVNGYGYANIFYVRDAKGAVWAVRCVWNYCWYVSADSVALPRPREWSAGNRVLARDSDS